MELHRRPVHDRDHPDHGRIQGGARALDIVTRGEKGIESRIEEFGVPEDSFIAGRTIGELRIGERTGAMILATRNREGTFDTTPSASDRLRAGDTLIVLGTREQVGRLERLMGGGDVTEEA
jgi:K+/H+ antiporter YhaU regulatory subunit KhtT